MSFLQIVDLSMSFQVGSQTLQAVCGMNLDIKMGECVGLVGESGCGKSTAGRAILRLYKASGGKVLFNGVDIFALPSSEMKAMRRKMQIIFQDPYASLNPRMTVQDIIGEALDIHGLATGPAREARIAQLLELVGLNSEHMYRFPHEFSGGQRQRVGIARALAVEPEFIICDEAISALDVSIQAQIVNLLKDLQKKMGLTYLFIAHDLSMVEYIADRVAVMYLGHIVELADSKDLYHKPLHPYTEALFSAIPTPDPEFERKRQRIVLPGEVPSPMNPPKGCPFCTRCPKVMDICHSQKPKWQEEEPGHMVACHLYSKEGG